MSEAFCCTCGHPRLNIFHSMGAQVSCSGCDKQGPFVPGRNYQQEEQAAIAAWNRMIEAELITEGAPQHD